MKFVDSHCHLDFFSPQMRETVFKRAAERGVCEYIIPAVARENWQAVADLSQIAGCFAAYGLHPVYTKQHQVSDVQALDYFLRTQRVVAIGECGLDYFVHVDRNQQQFFFEAQLQLAQFYDLPVIIHARWSLEDVLQTLQKYRDVNFVVHSFSGSMQQLDRLLDLGGYVGIGGTLTYSRAKRLREQMSQFPATQYLLETDAPDQPLAGHQGQKNEPANVVDVAQILAELRQVPVSQIAGESRENTQRLFHL